MYLVPAAGELAREEAADRVEVERLAEAAGTADEGDRVPGPLPVAHEAGLVDVEAAAGPQSLEALSPLLIVRAMRGPSLRLSAQCSTRLGQ